MRRGRTKGMPKQLNPDVLEEKFILVRDLYRGWCSLPERIHSEAEKMSCENLLEELLGFVWRDGETDYFIDDEDLRERVEEWLERTELLLKERFEQRLREACLNRLRWQRKG